MHMRQMISLDTSANTTAAVHVTWPYPRDLTWPYSSLAPTALRCYISLDDLYHSPVVWIINASDIIQMMHGCKWDIQICCPEVDMSSRGRSPSDDISTEGQHIWMFCFVVWPTTSKYKIQGPYAWHGLKHQFETKIDLRLTSHYRPAGMTQT